MLGEPESIQAPFFAYGSLQPGELAFAQVRDLVKDSWRTSARGSLLVLDGLPLLRPDQDDGLVQGTVLSFGADASSAYERIREFEPSAFYRWDVLVLEDETRANVLAGRERALRRADLLEDSHWSFSLDPAFNQGFATVTEIADECRAATDAFDSAPPDAFHWPRFYRLSAAYLLLWSIVERYTALAFGPRLQPEDRIRRLQHDESFARAAGEVIGERREVADARRPDQVYALTSESAAEYYYRVRSNLSHRGKAAWRDGEIVRAALVELTDIFQQMLDERLAK